MDAQKIKQEVQSHYAAIARQEQERMRLWQWLLFD